MFGQLAGARQRKQRSALRGGARCRGESGAFWFAGTRALLHRGKGCTGMCTSRHQSYFEHGLSVVSLHGKEFCERICLFGSPK